MTQQDTITSLNGLIQVSKDGEKGFLEASKHAHAPELRALFATYSADCTKSALELQQCVQLLGGKAEHSGTISGSLHRGWMDLKASLSSKDDLMLLEECERGEDHAKAQYVHALKGDLAASVKTMLTRQHEGSVRHHDRIRDLRNRARATA